jgi:hypothetical protein
MKISPTVEILTMRSRTFALFLGITIATCTSAAAADDLYVICSAGVVLQPSEIRNVFIGEKAFAGSAKLVPADNSAAQAAFLEKVLKLDAVKYAGLWTKKSFRDGANPPPVKSSDAEAIAFVKSTAGACSYVTSIPAGLTPVAKF